MMKIKLLSRNPDDHLRETKDDIRKVARNFDPKFHPFEASREYVRALNATKLERTFAKPFIGCLEGHKDGLSVLKKHPTSLSTLLSGAHDGEVKVWNLPTRKSISTVQAHTGVVNSICFHPKGKYFFTCGRDKTIKQWNVDEEFHIEEDPTNVILGQTLFHAIDHHWKDDIFATCGEQVDIWDESRAEPIRSYSWGVDSVQSLKFNPVEHHLLGATACDRSIILYDMRGTAPLRKVLLQLKSNALAWNPMEPFVFTVANEDYNLYSFDMRNLSKPTNIHIDHVNAVIDVDYCPTGREFVSAGWDKCIRIFACNMGHSREVYFTKRMQRVQQVQWSLDNKYILSGSDEMNIRIWKAQASEKLGPLKPREKAAFNYNEKLKEKFGHHPEIKRISRHRHVPKFIYRARKEIKTMKESEKRKEKHRMIHSKPEKEKSTREKVVLNVKE
ncbi:DDB1- and CUL4-associated factor 13 [Octopus bimaculoides]|uniref:DDB1- and CUL4-associated factor 13 n=1 Tax=Octopus bimaculoides TaxID=37653 RepID=A0A0L8I6D3_OCTBM|nr:DDB1- and CUL4-associated factor 13 [Octopus bimaculoides]|eukprot:XP_014790792.1 PREDICTED: DDB1- and CUL4-associated factor 13-like [Octopus bimaculoides]